MSKSNFLTQFREGTREERRSLLADLLFESSQNLNYILPILATREIDEQVFLGGLSDAIEIAPNNLPALRAASWHHIRNSNYETAKNVLLQVVHHWPNHRDFRLELLRVEMLAPSESPDKILALGCPALVDPLSAASYRYQLALAHPQLAVKGQVHELINQARYASARSILSIFERNVSFSPTSQKNLWVVLGTILKAKSVALVGNGPSLRGQKKAEEIEEHELVIRCNFPKLDGFEADVGSRTDVMFCTEALLENLHAFVGRHSSYQSVPMISVHPEDIKTPNFDVITSSLDIVAARLSSAFRLAVRQLFYARPTTGLMAIVLLVVLLEKRVSLFGFDFYQDVKDAHYFKQGADVFLGHEIQYEAFFFNNVLERIFGERLVKSS